MIHAAHIGVGLFGVEGTEASSSADYALPEFKHLRRLLFYHGLNIGYMMNYYTQLFLFKSIVFAIQPLFFAFFDGYSGEKTFEDVYLMAFKILFTNLNLGAYLFLE
jgi:phospholipid-transporting ATPase